MPFYRMPDGEQLFVREYGQGQPVLVLSGLGMLSWQWSAFLYPYGKQFKFIIPEWRGFGASKKCNIPKLDAISSHWQDLNCLLEQLDHQNLIVIAYSMGATTTMHGLKYGNFEQYISAYLHIDQTPKIAVDHTWSFGLFGAQYHNFIDILKELSDLLEAHQHITYFRDLDHVTQQQIAAIWLRFIQLQNNNTFSLKALKWLLNQKQLQTLLLPSDRLDYMAWYINNYLHHDEDYRAALKKLTCPVTFISGVQSKLYPIEGQTIVAKSLGQAKHIRFDKSGHTPLLTEPLKFAQTIGQFLKENKHLNARSTSNVSVT